eukprot:CAMPEP_0113636204 /NCGR_PEP_ID=MMETSP0017_2-20120614/18898_1 /TAXON_ID=2856 /ORGANISM="Cylindrotheca closterium" /LENGTH=442 /DNA_ID=CAMNT_0000547069 /DNA_START=21 /DNA_END=1349 /DNA_ORIENTATION=- /assembly_acc=CAM_ASM_000147
MKFPSLIVLLTAITSVSGKKEDEKEPPAPTMAFVHHLTLSDSKICGDGEIVQVECGLNIMERLPIPEKPEDEKKEKDKDKEQPPDRLRRRLPKEEDTEPVELPPLFSSDVYEMEITNCTNSVKGQNRTLYFPGRQLIVEAEGFQNIDVASVDPYNNTESIMTRQGRIKFWEPPTEWQQLMGYQKSNHIGNLLFKVIVERKQIIDETEMFVGMTLTMQAMADAIMLNDTGVMFPEPVPAYKNYTQVISAELDWEHLVNVACSPEKFATAMPTPQPSPQPSANPTAPSVAPSMEPSVNPSLSLVPSDIPSTVPTPLPSSIPSMGPSTVPSSSPSTVPSTVPSSGPSTVPSTVPSSAPSALPSTSPSGFPTDGSVTNMVHPDFDTFTDDTSTSGTSPSRGPSTQQQYQRPYDAPIDEDDLSEYTREYYGEAEEVHDSEKPDLITP